MRKPLLLSLLLLIPFLADAQITKKNVLLPLPSKAQLRFQNYEQIMFLCIDPATWQGREFDDLSTPLKRINPSNLNTDQWCEVAKSWDAKLILFVAKHVGGFCWWQTNTTEYSIKNTPWKNGKGDVIMELSKSCKKFGLDLGIYVYPGDPHFDAPLGSGGVTKDPSKQEAYNRIYCQQMKEVLTRYGEIREVWFDGSCQIKCVNEILEKYASDAVIMAGPLNNIREVGNEEGYAPFSNWNTLTTENLKKGVADAIQSDPFGDAYAPIETCVPLLRNKGHKWFWGNNTDHLILTQEQLMNMYYKSVGRGAVLLLNATPDTTGSIPESHVKAYREFGKEIRRRFDHPVNRTKGEGNRLQITFPNPTEINHVVLQEDLAKGQRVLAFVIEGLNDKGLWIKVYDGTSVGHQRICHFDPITLKKIRVSFTNVKAKPQISEFAVYNIPGVNPEPEKRMDNNRFYNFIANKKGTDQIEEPVIEIGKWDLNSYGTNWKEVRIDLTKYVTLTGQYEITFSPQDKSKEPELDFKDWEMEMYGGKTTRTIELLKEIATFRITRSQQTLDEFPTILRLKIRCKPDKSSGSINLKRITY